MKNSILKLTALALLIAPFGVALPALAAAPQWDTTGSYVITMNYLGTGYPHDMTLAQAADGTLTGNGGNPVGANVYTWVLTSGTVSGNTISFTANYTATADAVTPQTTINVVGTIASDGTMSGSWSDNYRGGVRTGSWTSTTGTADALPPVITPTMKNQCKNGGWKTFTNPSFKNQGQCVASVVSKKK